MITLYGIKNCDSVRKAKKYLEAAGVAYSYHDFREQGLAAAQLSDWLRQLGAEQLVNRRSTTWKNLSQPERDLLSAPGLEKAVRKQQHAAIDLLRAQPTLIKRPVTQFGNGAITVGFSAENYQRLLGN